jgi:hypothetical protein
VAVQAQLPRGLHHDPCKSHSPTRENSLGCIFGPIGDALEAPHCEYAKHHSLSERLTEGVTSITAAQKAIQVAPLKTRLTVASHACMQRLSGGKINGPKGPMATHTHVCNAPGSLVSRRQEPSGLVQGLVAVGSHLLRQSLVQEGFATGTLTNAEFAECMELAFHADVQHTEPLVTKLKRAILSADDSPLRNFTAVGAGSSVTAGGPPSLPACACRFACIVQ